APSAELIVTSMAMSPVLSLPSAAARSAAACFDADVDASGANGVFGGPMSSSIGGSGGGGFGPVGGGVGAATTGAPSCDAGGTGGGTFVVGRCPCCACCADNAASASASGVPSRGRGRICDAGAPRISDADRF